MVLPARVPADTPGVSGGLGPVPKAEDPDAPQRSRLERLHWTWEVPSQRAPTSRGVSASPRGGCPDKSTAPCWAAAGGQRGRGRGYPQMPGTRQHSQGASTVLKVRRVSSERLSHLSKPAQQEGGRARVRPREPLTPKPTFIPSSKAKTFTKARETLKGGEEGVPLLTALTRGLSEGDELLPFVRCVREPCKPGGRKFVYSPFEGLARSLCCVPRLFWGTHR